MKSAIKLFCACLLASGIILTPAVQTSAQTYTATLTGTISDPQGSSVPNVKVIVTNQGTKLEYTAETSESGVYTIFCRLAIMS